MKRSVRETLAEMLVAVDHKVELAESGQEAVEKMRDGSLILCLPTWRCPKWMAGKPRERFAKIGPT